jgi:adenine deaminase
VEANRRFNALMRARGYRFSDPLFSLLFLSFESLPWGRLTSRGVWDVRARRALAPAAAL